MISNIFHKASDLTHAHPSLKKAANSFHNHSTAEHKSVTIDYYLSKKEQTASVWRKKNKQRRCRMPNVEKMNEHIKTIKKVEEGVDWLHLNCKMHKLRLIGLKLMRLFRLADRLMTGTWVLKIGSRGTWTHVTSTKLTLNSAYSFPESASLGSRLGYSLREIASNRYAKILGKTRNFRANKWVETKHRFTCV